MGKTNSQLSGGGLTLIDIATVSSQYDGSGESIISTFFPSYTATNSLWVIIAENNTSTVTNKLLYVAGSFFNGTNKVAGVSRGNGVYDRNYSVQVAGGATLKLYAIDYDDYIPS